MENSINKLVGQAFGLIQATTEQVQKTIVQMTQDRKLTLEEGKKAYEDFLKNTESKREEFEQQVSKIFEKMAHNLKIATHKDLEQLQEKIDALEKKVIALENKNQEN